MKTFLPMEEPGADWPPAIDHISATSLKMFSRCPEQWRRRYILDERQAPSGALIQGKADHHAIESSFMNKMDKGTDLSVEDVRTQFAERFDVEVDSAGGYDEIVWDKQATTTTERRRLAGRIKDAGVELAALYRTEASPYVWPTSVEEEFELVVPGVPVKVQGRLDLIALDFNTFTQEPIEDTSKLVERKTAARSTMQPEWKLQAQIYQLAKPQPLDFHMSLKAGRVLWGKPELRVETSEVRRSRTLEYVSMLIREIESCYRMFGPDHAWPGAIAHPWACSFCGWREVCHWHTNL